MNSIFTFILFLIYVLYNIITISVLDNDQSRWTHGLVGGSIGFLSILSLFIYYYYYIKTKESKISKILFVILFGIILITGYVFSILNTFEIINDKDENDKDAENKINILRSKTIFSGLFFTMIGAISWLLNYLLSDCNSINELLCNKNIVIILILSNIVVYNSINYLKLHGSDLIWIKDKEDKKDEENIGMDSGVIIMLCLWQVYIYFLVDGFKGVDFSNIITKNSSGDKTIPGMFSGLSVFVILSLLIITFISNSQCESWKNTRHVNNFKEISYNMLMTTVISVIIIGITKK